MANDIYDIRRLFKETLYVERQEELSKAQAWKNSNRRVLTVTSPPANGKTWFLNHFQQILQQRETPLTFKIDIRDFLRDGLLGFREIDPIALQARVRQFATELRAQCGSVPLINDEAETASILNVLADHISRQCWPGEPIYLFVDGGDEPSSASWKTIERQILEPILAHPHWRLIIALRQSQRLYSHVLRKTEQPLELTPLIPLAASKTHPGHEQLIKLIKEQESTGKLAPPLDSIIGILPDYNWIHPGLNYFLFLEASTHYSPSEGIKIQPDLMERGITALTDLPDPQQIIEWLITICQNQRSDEWLIEDLELTFGKSRREAWSIITDLQTHLLITNTDNRYRITDGVREFVRAI